MSTSNIYPFKDDLSGIETLNFPIPVRELQITNMSGSAALNWKFREDNDYNELEPTEIITIMDISTNKLILSANSGSYRVIGKG